MARLIIGHTTDRSVNIWVRGSERYAFGHVKVFNEDITKRKQIELEARHGYTGAVKITGLAPQTRYSVEVRFSNEPRAVEKMRFDFGHCNGGFKTFRSSDDTGPIQFVFGSCNLHTLGYFRNSDTAYSRLAEEADQVDADFMLHCGDQVYFDVPPTFDVSEQSYREKYLDAWSDCRPARKFLTERPHYMILDDHEIVDNFSNDKELFFGGSIDKYRNPGIKVYREFQYIHSPRNHGNDCLHYSFACGEYQFFVLDTRSERFRGKNRIISILQMKRFKSWLKKHKDQYKFVVSSVPFIASNVDSDDKWNGYPEQREEVIDFLYSNEIDKLVFLCGDQHHSLKATMEAEKGGVSRVWHELMSSPINQIFKPSYSVYEGMKTGVTAGGVSYKSTVKKGDFFNKHSNAMAVTVSGGRVQYNLFRTKKKKSYPRKTFDM